MMNKQLTLQFRYLKKCWFMLKCYVFQMFEYREVGEKLKYYYTLREGYTTHSLAAKIALKMGLGKDIVERAKTVSNFLN